MIAGLPVELVPPCGADLSTAKKCSVTFGAAVPCASAPACVAGPHLPGPQAVIIRSKGPFSMSPLAKHYPSPGNTPSSLKSRLVKPLLCSIFEAPRVVPAARPARLCQDSAPQVGLGACSNLPAVTLSARRGRGGQPGRSRCICACGFSRRTPGDPCGMKYCLICFGKSHYPAALAIGRRLSEVSR
ncbi:hypothetical protein D3C78_667350 [compost metagenome]